MRLNNLGDLVGEQPILARERLELQVEQGTLQPKVLGVLPGGDYSCASSINERDKSLEPQTSATPSFHNLETDGRLQRIPCCWVIRWQGFGINKTGMWLDILRAPMAPEPFLDGRDSVQNLGSLPGAGTAERVTLTTRMRCWHVRNPVGDRAVCGQQAVMYAILVSCGKSSARLSQSIMLVMCWILEGSRRPARVSVD